MSTNVQTKEDVLSVLGRNALRIKGFGVKRVGLFGSFARREQDVRSDIDFLVEFDPEEKTFDNFMNLSFLLEELTGRRVELVTTESLSPHIGPHILEEVEDVSLDS